MAATTAPVRVVVLAYPRVDELDLFGAYSVLAKAAPRFDVRIAARDEQVTGSGGVTFTAGTDLAAVESADAVVVPGGRGAVDAAADAGLREVLRAADSRGAAMYGVCSGTLLIAAAGLADGRRVAVHHGKRELLRAHPVGDVVSGLVRDGRVSTVGGDHRDSVKSVDLAFALLADFAADLVEPISTRMETRPGRRAS
ncbi:DJ-1/PfpI family protein [Lentzea sp. BCCO 10_0856]|uniref:DJ-1/PfpI family protein n=1 Tax=Lentzea miocenica TaxID=3095431 RepID=A0ABU4SYU8_9PSEU|nr:DJ-1/PfpI family protein [Lentzea sp. BCCO 10_0856]MDX8031048.1 DJ-1/PfpI family protein [Lentzea sp. BCCO 10_0856]